MPRRQNGPKPNCYPPGESGIDIQSDGGHVKYGPGWNTGAGKGSKRRPGDREAYRQGWERIFGDGENT